VLLLSIHHRIHHTSLFRLRRRSLVSFNLSSLPYYLSTECEYEAYSVRSGFGIDDSSDVMDNSDGVIYDSGAEIGNFDGIIDDPGVEIEDPGVVINDSGFGIGASGGVIDPSHAGISFTSSIVSGSIR
jgi:hypothetical protein